ncbi:MAG: FAD:protein FMN transferase [Bacteroidia bacterium]|nr:FAD:protein FMN transferase [Bacteroidia bacterium]
MQININFLISFLILFISCHQNRTDSFNHILTSNQDYYQFHNGYAQGTTFNISYKSDINFNNAIDLILKEFSHSLSIFDSSSVISRINRNDPKIVPDEYFIQIFKKSAEIYKTTGGAFDITVGPLVNAWGFGATDKMNFTKPVIDSLLIFVGMDKVRIEDNKIIKSDERVTFDANAIAQGYSVDIIAGYLKQKGLTDFMVEIGGEVYAQGKNKNGVIWKIGIDKPLEDPYALDRQLQAVVALDGKAIATSGSYRKFRIENGVKYSHTIDPATGYPVNHNLLSVSILADDCITADAYATAFMVFGFDKSLEFLKHHPELEAFFIYSSQHNRLKTYTTEGFKKLFQD